jgi:hypothetical protein
MEEKPIMHKIAIVLNNAWAAYNFRYNLAKSIQDNGYEVIFIIPNDNNYFDILKKDFAVIEISIDAKGINPINDLKTIINLYKLYKLIKPDMVLNFTIKPNIYSSIVAGVLGIKAISNISGLGTIFIKQSFITKIAKLLYKVALGFNYKVFFQNNDDKSLFINNKIINKNKADLLPGSGVDLNKFTPIKKKKMKELNFCLLQDCLKIKVFWNL